MTPLAIAGVAILSLLALAVALGLASGNKIDRLVTILFVLALAAAALLVLRDWTNGNDGCHGGFEKMPTPRETIDTKQRKAPSRAPPSRGTTGGRGRTMLTVKQVADRLGVSADTVYALCQSKRLRHVRVGVGRGHIRVSEEALAEYLAGAAVGGTQEKPAPRPQRQPVRLKHLRS